MNDGIDPRLCSVDYASVDDAVTAIVRLGRGARLAKFDLESAYRMVPVHPRDRLLLGMRWEGATYVDGSLPFWATIGSEVIHSSSGCYAVDNAPARSA